MIRARSINGKPIIGQPIADDILTSGVYDFTSAASGELALRKLGAWSTATRGSVARYYSYAQNKWIEVDSNVIRFSDNPYNGKKGLLVEGEGGQNQLKYSSEPANATWLSGGGTMVRSTVGLTALIDGKTPALLTAVATGNFLYQAVGTFSGNPENAYVIFELPTSNTANSVDIGVYNTTGGAFVARIRLTFATGAVTLISGTAGMMTALQYEKTGPNGGAVWVVTLVCTGTAGQNRRFVMYPSPQTGTKAIIMHHAQFQETAHGCSPIVTAGATGTQAAELVFCNVPPGIDFQSNDPFTLLITHSVLIPSRTPQDTTYLTCPLAIAKADISSFVACIQNFLGGSSLFYLLTIDSTSYAVFDPDHTPVIGSEETTGISRLPSSLVSMAANSYVGQSTTQDADVDSPVMLFGIFGSGCLLHRFELHPYGVSGLSLARESA